MDTAKQLNLFINGRETEDKTEQRITKLGNLMKVMGIPFLEKLYNRIHVADRVINEMAEKHPQSAAIIQDAFRYCSATDVLRNKGMRLYECHVKEIIQRIVDGEDLEPATDAELLAVFSEMSLKAPLIPEFATAYYRLFDEHFDEDIQMPEHEPYPGRIDEIYSEIRRRFTFNRDIKERL